MGKVRPVSTQVDRYVLRWRTFRGRATAIRHLDLLAVAVQAESYRFVKRYQADEFPTRPPLLWVYAFSQDDHIRVAVTVHAIPGQGWACYEARRGRYGYLCPCGDTKHVADQVDAALKHRMLQAPAANPAGACRGSELERPFEKVHHVQGGGLAEGAIGGQARQHRPAGPPRHR
ncbi:Uncharacterised protein [Mycobacterium tuberculosis]|nr:Uncharacterised protein [Mycobacterium tuberculosis]